MVDGTIQRIQRVWNNEIMTQGSDSLMRCICHALNRLKTQITMKLAPAYGVAQEPEVKAQAKKEKTSWGRAVPSSGEAGAS